MASEDITNVLGDGHYEEINLKESLTLKDVQHAVHCCVFAKWDAEIPAKGLQMKAALLMQIRRDGMLGFVGGIVDPGEEVAEALMREMVEELNFDVSRFPIGEQHYVISHICRKMRMCLHLFALEVSLEQFSEIERRALYAEDYGKEVFGITRVPLFLYKDGLRGLPAFLKNSFVGNSREQLLLFLLRFKFLSASEIAKAWKSPTALKTS